MQSPEPEPNIDPLTGLYKPSYGIEVLRRVVDEANALITIHPSRVVFTDGAVGVVFMDIYQLKKPHDKYGHPPIDEVIRDVGKVIQNAARENDTACRYGGDEFLLIMPGATVEETTEKADQIRQATAKVRVVVDGEPREYITLSIGVAHFPSIYKEGFHSKLSGAEALMRAADEDLEKDRIRNELRQR